MRHDRRRVTAVIPQCIDDTGKVRRCRGCPSLGTDKSHRYCDAVVHAAAAAAISALDAALARPEAP